jgi:hypothetical protein
MPNAHSVCALGQLEHDRFPCGYWSKEDLQVTPGSAKPTLIVGCQRLQRTAHKSVALVLARVSCGPGSSVRCGEELAYIFFAKCEVVLHRLLCILIVRLALGRSCQRQEEVDQDQCLDQDVALEGDIAKLRTISDSSSTMLQKSCIPQA